MTGRCGIPDFPETVSAGHWGGYDTLEGWAFGPAQWGPVREQLTYLAGFALAHADESPSLDAEGRQLLSASVAGFLCLLQDGAARAIEGDYIPRILGAAEVAHFNDNPDEGVRFGCPTCDALLDVHEALGLPPTQWVRAWLVECRKHEDCPGCPLEPECERKRAEMLAKARVWAAAVTEHCLAKACDGCPDAWCCRDNGGDEDWVEETRADYAHGGFPDTWDDETLMERWPGES